MKCKDMEKHSKMPPLNWQPVLTFWDISVWYYMLV